MKNKFFIIALLLLPLMIFAEAGSQSNTKDPSIEEVNENQEIAVNDLEIQDFQNQAAPSENAELNPTFPINTSVGYNLDSDEGKYFFQAEGQDDLTEKSQINFLIKFPFVQQVNNKTKLDAKPDAFLVNFLNPALSLSIGDKKYSLSPLTVSEYKARGSSINANINEKLGFDTIYLLATPKSDNKLFNDDNEARRALTSFYVKPIKDLKLAANILYTNYLDQSPNDTKNNFTYSVNSSFSKKNTNFDVEVANTNSIETNNYAVFSKLKGKLKNFKYDLNAIYASPNFIGKYTNQSKLDNKIEFDIKDLKIKASQKLEKENLNKLLSLKKAKRKSTEQISFAYPVFDMLNAEIAYTSIDSQDILKNNGFKLDSVTLTSKTTIDKSSFSVSPEVGKYRSKLENFLTRNWSNVKFTYDYTPMEQTTIGVYSKLGNILHEDIFTNSFAIGTDTKISFVKNLDLTFGYEFSYHSRSMNYTNLSTKPNWKRHYFKEDLTYTFENNHKITLSSHFNKPLTYKKEKALLFTYSVPLQVPSINKTVSNIRNRFL